MQSLYTLSHTYSVTLSSQFFLRENRVWKDKKDEQFRQFVCEHPNNVARQQMREIAPRDNLGTSASSAAPMTYRRNNKGDPRTNRGNRGGLYQQMRHIFCYLTPFLKGRSVLMSSLLVETMKIAGIRAVQGTDQRRAASHRVSQVKVCVLMFSTILQTEDRFDRYTRICMDSSKENV